MIHKGDYRIYKTHSLDPIQTYTNPEYIVKLCFLKVYFNIIFKVNICKLNFVIKFVCMNNKKW
jgi:hypothetical protein